jgi:hypothetical protein
MLFQIKNLVLWPKDRSRKPRVLPFAPEKVNVISGASRTGKSAIIPIIDYCLGNEKCTIPVKTVRDASAWFGVVIKTDEGEKLFARREPGDLKATSDMFLSEGERINIPDVITSKNATADAAKRMLDRIAGLSSLGFDSEQQQAAGFKGRPSFRDMMAFVFQPQNIVANPDVLFYKADTYEHREKLRTIFPYVLNAITPGLLAIQHELADLRKELKRKRNELENLRVVSDRWLAEVHGHIDQAKELGLVKAAVPNDASYDDLLDILRVVVKVAEGAWAITDDGVEESVAELMQLRKEEERYSLQLSGLKNRLSQMTALRESTKDYKDSLSIQRDRLKISEWLGAISEADHTCPICGNHFDSANQELERLQDSLRNVEREAGEFQSIPAAFDREFDRVRSSLRITTEKLEACKIRARALQVTSEKAKERQYSSLRVSRFLGSVEQALNTYDAIGSDSSLATEVAELEGRVRDLEKEISEGQIRDRTARAVRIVNTYASRLLPNLDCESPSDPVSLSIEDLTVSVEGPSRTDFLWEIGSGSNWLSYHVAISLGLQQFFLSTTRTPVPSFLVYDQPSQVYFPKRLVPTSGDADWDPQFKDEDVQAVRKVFQVFSETVKMSRGGLQIIVLDHAPESVWGNIEHVDLVEEWRGGQALVPGEWLGT